MLVTPTTMRAGYRGGAVVFFLSTTVIGGVGGVASAFLTSSTPTLLTLDHPLDVAAGGGRRYNRVRRRKIKRSPPGVSLGLLRNPGDRDRRSQVNGLEGGGSAGRRRNRSDDEPAPPPCRPDISPELSTFWRAVAEIDRPTEDNVCPVEQNLDSDGPLPFGAYRTVGREEFEVPRMCLVTVSLDFSPSNGGRVLDPASNRPMWQLGQSDGMGRDNAEDAVRNVCRLVDAGFTTFQIAQPEEGVALSDSGVQEWAERNVYGRLRTEVPPSVLRGCHLMTRVGVPPAVEAVFDTANAQPFGNGFAVREEIGASLKRIGSECIDSVQVPYVKDSPYHLDVLNVLFDAKREGIIRSIGGLNFPPSLIQSAEDCGFHLDTNRVQCNILDPNPFEESLSLCSSVGTKLIVGSPLAGGLLTDRFLQMPDMPHPLYFSSAEKRHLTTLQTWADRRHHDGDGSGGDTSIWSLFHRDVLGALADISRKHRVPLAAVALRSALRKENLGSVVVSSRVGAAAEREERGVGGYELPQSLRQLFSFDLDEEDEERLWHVSGRKQLPSFGDQGLSHVRGKGEAQQGSAGGLVPDLSNRKLWL